MRRNVSTAVAGITLLAMVTLSSCTTARNGLGPQESPCFRALPAAEVAVGGEGRLAGIKYVSPQILVTVIRNEKSRHPMSMVPPALAAVMGPACLVEYRGHFTTAYVQNGWSPIGAPTGTYAVVVVPQSNSDVVATVVLQKEPIRFNDTYPSL